VMKEERLIELLEVIEKGEREGRDVKEEIKLSEG
jgi:hypothetical protein